ncbi:MAG: hypothetical protein LQ342_007460 [Letrouitia transgressa]|nr:MAG: hypothetical protein LQ342_007460 [Letrouitia transgressa]
MKTSGKKIGLKERAIKPPFRKTTLFQRVVLVAGLVSLLSAQLWRKWMFNKLAGQMKIFRDHGDNDIPLSGYSSDSNEPWASITPSSLLDFHDCFDGFQCARLDLPMDWNQTDAESGPRVQLAVVKLPAKVPVTDIRYGGPLWLQSGGPGESGVDFVLQYAHSVQMVVDARLHPHRSKSYTGIAEESQTEKFFDVIGIDSRGLNNSTPCFSCFPTVSSKETWNLQSAAEGVLGSSDTTLPNLWARMQALGGGCSAKAANNENDGDRLAFFVNTTPQIADMVAILEQHGRWREREARQRLHHEEAYLSEQDRFQITERTRWKKNEETLLFWGVSYGTVIGATFAAMQPQRVKRIVIDGVVDTLDYFLGERLHALQDTDAEIEQLTAHCDLAGPQRCPLYSNGGSTNILHTFYDLIDSLRHNPIGVPASLDLAPDLITYSDVISAVFNALYAPIQDFPPLAQRLLDLSKGNGTSFAVSKQISQRRRYVSPLPRGQPVKEDACHVQRHAPGDTRMAIICTDTNATQGMTRDAYEAYIKTLRSQSPLMAGIFAHPRMLCVNWNLRPKWRFPGPFVGKLQNPLLAIGTARDPVAPIRK